MGANPVTPYAILDEQRMAEELAARSGGAQDLDTIVMFDDFFGNENQAPNGNLWEADTSKGASAVQSGNTKGSGWLELALPSESAAHHATVRAVSSQIFWPEDGLTFETRIAFQGADTLYEHHVGFQPAPARFTLIGQEDNTLKVYCGGNGSENYSGEVLAANTAYKLKVVVDAERHTRFYLDGVLLTIEDTPIVNASFCIPEVQANKSGGGINGSMFVDYIRATSAARRDFWT